MRETFKATIGDIKFGKKTTVAIEIKGDLSDSQKLALLEFAHSDGWVQLATAQKDIGDYGVKDPRTTYTVNNGEVNVDPEQLDMDDLVEDGDVLKESPIDATPELVDAGEWTEKEQPSEDMEKQIIMVSVEVLKAFKYQEKSVKKGSIIQVPLDIAQGLDNSGVVKLIVDDGLPF